jgi:hypothetical protein
LTSAGRAVVGSSGSGGRTTGSTAAPTTWWVCNLSCGQTAY